MTTANNKVVYLLPLLLVFASSVFFSVHFVMPQIKAYTMKKKKKPLWKKTQLRFDVRFHLYFTGEIRHGFLLKACFFKLFTLWKMFTVEGQIAWHITSELCSKPHWKYKMKKVNSFVNELFAANNLCNRRNCILFFEGKYVSIPFNS